MLVDAASETLSVSPGVQLLPGDASHTHTQPSDLRESDGGGLSPQPLHYSRRPACASYTEEREMRALQWLCFRGLVERPPRVGGVGCRCPAEDSLSLTSLDSTRKPHLKYK